MRLTLKAIGVATLMMMALSSDPLLAQEDFFAGKTIHLIIPAGPGGAFGTFGQLLSKYLPEQIRGHPLLVPQFMPGAGGIRASDYVANSAAIDGTVIYLVHESAITHQLLFPDQVKYDVSKFIPIGIVSSLNGALVLRSDAPAKDVASFKKTQVVLGSTGRGSYQYVVPILMNQFQDMKLKMITGFPGINEMILAVDRGEIQGMLGSLVAFQTSRPDWITGGGTARIVFQMGDRPDPAIPNIPLLTELAASDEERALYAFLSLERSLGRALVAPAGVPEDRIRTLRNALQAVLTDKEFRTFCAEHRIPLVSGTAEDLKVVTAKAFATKPATVETARKYMTEK